MQAEKVQRESLAAQQASTQAQAEKHQAELRERTQQHEAAQRELETSRQERSQ